MSSPNGGTTLVKDKQTNSSVSISVFGDTKYLQSSSFPSY